MASKCDGSEILYLEDNTMNIYGNGFMTNAEAKIYQSYEDAEDLKKILKILQLHMKKNLVGNRNVSLFADVEEEVLITQTKPTIQSL